MLPYLVIIIEFICFSLAFLFLRKVNDWWRIFMPYLCLVLFTETVGLFHPKNGNNYWIYNLYLAVYFLISFLILSRICDSLFRIKPYFLIGLSIVGITYFIESILSNFKGLSIRSYSLANAFIVIICCSYYYHLLKQEGFIEIKKHAPFWIVTGLLFFCFGSTVSYLFFDTLAQINIKYGLPVRQVIFIVLNFILYSCWSYAFLCRYRQKT